MSLPTPTPKDCSLGLDHRGAFLCAEKLMLVLLRKEVIQPLVPLRLPCYDFILVTDHTFGASLLVKG